MNWYRVSLAEVAEEAKRRKRIPDEEFHIVLDWATIPTADFVVTRVVGGIRQFLLVLRNEEPWKGEYFVPGGRILPGVLPYEALKANCQRELGFVPGTFVPVGNLAVFNPARSTGEQKPWFSLWHLYEIPVKGVEINLNPTENKEFRWFSQIDPNFPEPVKEALRKVGF